LVERHPYKVDVAGSNPVLPTKYLKSLVESKSKKSKMVKTVGKMGKVLGLTKNNDQYEDVPDDLKWAIPLHEHLTGSEMKRWFGVRKAQSERRVERELVSRTKKLRLL
jgi:hypothetical protein